MNIDLAVLKSVSMAASDSEVRYYLKGVYLECCDDFFILTATDGLILISAKSDYFQSSNEREEYLSANPKKSFRIASHIIPLELIKRIKLNKKSTFGTIDLVNNKIRIEYLGAVYEQAPLDATYPNWRHVVPSSISNTVSDFKPEQVLKLQKAREIMGHTDTIKISHNGDNAALVNIVYDRIVGVIMPIKTIAKIERPPHWVSYLPIEPNFKPYLVKSAA